MISFFCSHCGLKLQVKPEFAGRSSRCPTCKKPLLVPPPSQTQADVAAGQIDGTDSSLAKAGVEGGVTLEQGRSPRSGQKSVQDMLNRQARKGQRYVIEGEIARGGMGAVLRAVDCDIRREVAVKYLLDQSDPGKKLRFIEEAQITGQLEHPNIVPIHELGVDSQKRLFFSMKMVKGRSLGQVLDELRNNPKTAGKEYSLGRLLNIVVNVCHALSYAHARGVVHRDLKPANIMIGDFGEVYVMDWGLAKVLKGSGQGGEARPLAPPVPAIQHMAAQRSSTLQTSREAEADLTQEGAVLGTPVYMPPEQATGKVEAIDQRSDVYSLGAILYEMLTLQPPIDKEGGYLAILMRVMQGEITPPEQRDPKRARAGKIPKELSAIAMKALATNPQGRYPNVEALRRDIERFQEGRSVSAKEDTKREMLWKFVKRNKAFSAATFTGLVIVAVILAAYLREQAVRTSQATNAVPVFLQATRLLVKEREFQNALTQANLALTYQPNNDEALLLRGQLLIVEQDYAEAATVLGKYLTFKPGETEAKKLLELCQTARPHDDATLLAFAAVFKEQNAVPLEDGMLRHLGTNVVTVRQQLLVQYRQRIDKAWPGLGNQLSLDASGEYTLSLEDRKEVSDLTPLRGIPLVRLGLINCPVRDLSPLQNMRLATLSLAGCSQVRDLTPLKGMPLTTLNLGNCGQVSDLTPLKGMPLTTLDLYNTPVVDLSPLKGMPLTTLALTRCGQVSDLSPLKGMPLSVLNLGGCVGVSDLTALKGMPLAMLHLQNCGPVKDLTPLKGMPLTNLNLIGCVQVRDLTTLQGMNLTVIFLTPNSITKGIDVLRPMKSLKSIRLDYYDQKAWFSPEDFWKKYDAKEFNK